MKSRGRTSPAANAVIALPLLAAAALFALWPLGTSPAPHDHVDTLFNTWLLSWNVHALTSGADPMDLPIFSGFPDSGGRNDLLLTQSLASLPFRLAGAAPVLTHNLLMTFFLALAGFGTVLLAVRNGAGRAGSLFAGAAVILLPWFQSHLWHLQLFSGGLSLLAVYHSVKTAEENRGGWQIAVFILLQCLASLYLWFFLDLALLLLIPFLLPGKRRGALLRTAGWAAVGNALCLPFLLRHFANAGRWSADMVASTDAAAFLSPWENSILLGWMRPEGIHPEAALWPGLAVLAGFIWFLLKGRRSWLDGYLILCTAVFAVLSLGPTLVVFGHELSPAPYRLMAWLPGASSIRLPARGAFFALVPMALMAGKKLGERPGLAFAGILVAAAGVLHGPIETVPLPGQPWHQWLAGHHYEKVIYLPMSDDLTRPETETLRLIGAVCHFTPSVNGYSTTLPRDYGHVVQVMNGWPSEEATRMAEAFGADCIVVEGWEPLVCDTVFRTGGRPVSIVELPAGQ